MFTCVYIHLKIYMYLCKGVEDIHISVYISVHGCTLEDIQISGSRCMGGWMYGWVCGRMYLRM
jgi:hypothetical protein